MFLHLKNFVRRGAGSVVVSASGRNDGGPCLLPGRSRLVIFGMKTRVRIETDIVELCGWLCSAMCHAHWHATDVNSARMSHRPLYRYTAVGLCVYLRAKNGCAHIEGKEKVV